MTYKTSWMNDELQLLSDSVRRFYDSEMEPHEARWQEQGQVDRDFWNKAGAAGILCASIPEEYGGAGGDFRHEAVILTEQYHGIGFRASPMRSTARSVRIIFWITAPKNKRNAGCRVWPPAMRSVRLR